MQVLKKIGKAVWWIIKRFWWLILLIATAPFTVPGWLAKKRDERDELRNEKRRLIAEDRKEAKAENAKEYKDTLGSNPFRADKWGVRNDADVPADD